MGDDSSVVYTAWGQPRVPKTPRTAQLGPRKQGLGWEKTVYLGVCLVLSPPCPSFSSKGINTGPVGWGGRGLGVGGGGLGGEGPGLGGGGGSLGWEGRGLAGEAVAWEGEAVAWAGEAVAWEGEVVAWAGMLLEGTWGCVSRGERGKASGGVGASSVRGSVPSCFTLGPGVISSISQWKPPSWEL